MNGSHLEWRLGRSKTRRYWHRLMAPDGGPSRFTVKNVRGLFRAIFETALAGGGS